MRMMRRVPKMNKGEINKAASSFFLKKLIFTLTALWNKNRVARKYLRNDDLKM